MSYLCIGNSIHLLSKSENIYVQKRYKLCFICQQTYCWRLTPGFSGVRVARSFAFCVKFCISVFVLFHFISASDYSFGIFKLFCWPLYCLSSDLRLLSIPLIFCNCSYALLSAPIFFTMDRRRKLYLRAIKDLFLIIVICYIPHVSPLFSSVKY